MGRPGVLGAVLGGDGSEDEAVEEDGDDEPVEVVEVEEVSISTPLMEERFSSPTLRTPVSSRPAGFSPV